MFKYKHGFLVARMQPMHFGHISLINKMLLECENISVVFGSSQESRTKSNPFTVQERIEMFNNIYKNNNRMKIFSIKDYKNDNGWNNEKWLEELKNILSEAEKDFGKIEVFYCGGEFEASFFDSWNIKIELLDRLAQKGKEQISGTEIRDMIKNHDVNRWIL